MDYRNEFAVYHREKLLCYGGYEKIEKSFLNKLIRFETLLTAIQYFSWAKAGLPYMGVEEKFSFKKEEFLMSMDL
jgi:hypothetical protein